MRTASFAADVPTYPILIGADCRGTFFQKQKRDFWKEDAWYRSLDEFGIRYVDVHLYGIERFKTDRAAGCAGMILDIDHNMRRHGKVYTLNVELSNFRQSVEITPGVNEFEQPDGSHRWDLRMEWLRPLLPPAQTNRALLGISYDECEHMLLANNMTAGPDSGFDAPWLANTQGMGLETAYDRLVAAAADLRTRHYEGNVSLRTEQVWPDLFHLFARAGWTITPKALKENFTPVVLSIAMGAALQYSDRTRFQVSPDLWGRTKYPGHSAQSLRSALLMAYWVGAETVYVEGFDYNPSKPGMRHHPDAVACESLVRWIDDTHYEPTAYGRVFKDFVEYTSVNPRPITWRDYRPRVAIVRLPDGAWGQYVYGANEQRPWRNRLLGSRDCPVDAPAREWLQVWPVLTHGAVRPGAISYNNDRVYPEGIGEFFVPLDSVAVFDHTVTGPVLDPVECFVVCGHALSPETFAALRARAAKGATVLIAGRLYDRYAVRDKFPPGDWLVVDDFASPAVAAKLQPFLGSPDVARFRFARHTVEFKRDGTPDRIEVKVTPSLGAKASVTD